MSGIEPRGGRFKGDLYWMMTPITTWGNEDAQYTPIGVSNLTSTETDADTSMDFSVILRRMRVTIVSNTRTGASTIAFRQNAATPTGCSVSITAGTAGQFVTGVLSRAVNVNDLVDILYDGTGAGAATVINGVIWLYFQRVPE